MEYLYEVAKNGTSINKVKIAKECPRTYFIDRVVDKKVYKIEGNDELAGYNTYCWFFKDEETAKKWFNSIKNRDFSCKCETKIVPTGNQKAIECLEDVKKFLNKDHKESNKLLQEETEDDYYIQAVGARMSTNREYARYIDQKISELKGE